MSKKKNIIRSTKRRKVTCENCQRSWHPYKENPKQCPNCHIHLRGIYKV